MHRLSLGVWVSPAAAPVSFRQNAGAAGCMGPEEERQGHVISESPTPVFSGRLRLAFFSFTPTSV